MAKTDDLDLLMECDIKTEEIEIEDENIFMESKDEDNSQLDSAELELPVAVFIKQGMEEVEEGEQPQVEVDPLADCGVVNEDPSPEIHPGRLFIPAMQIDPPRLPQEKLINKNSSKASANDGLTVDITCSVESLGSGRNQSYLHNKIHLNGSNKPSYECTECEKFFKDKYQLDSHMLFHTLKKPFQCSVCNKGFFNKTCLAYHKETHQNEMQKIQFHSTNSPVRLTVKYCRRDDNHIKKKRFECPVCHIKFSERGNLGLHMPIHTKKKTFICAVCKQKFSWIWQLKQHMEIHNAKKDFLEEILS